MDRVLITGSTSTVARAIGGALASMYNIFYAGRQNADYYLDLNSTDISRFDNLQFDIVIHAAADFGGVAEEDIYRAEMVNAMGTFNVCALAKQVKARHILIISSLSASYVQGDAYFGIYSLSKRHGDELAQLYCSLNSIPLTILRPTQLFDAGSLCRAHQPLFYTIIDKAISGEDIAFHGTNDALRNYLFIDDFVEIVTRVIQRSVTGTYNCVSRQSYRLSEMAQIAYQIFNRGGHIIFLKDKPNIADLPECAIDNLYEKIGFEPRINLTQGMQLIKEMRETR